MAVLYRRETTPLCQELKRRAVLHVVIPCLPESARIPAVRACVAVTDRDWYRVLRDCLDLDEVNFGQPGGNRQFKTLKPGEPFLFKLHYPDNVIAGGGFFTHASLLDASIAWDAFGPKNGAPSYLEMCRRIEPRWLTLTSIAEFARGPFSS